MHQPFPLDAVGVGRGRGHHAVPVVIVPLQELLSLHLHSEQKGRRFGSTHLFNRETFSPPRTHLLNVLEPQRPLVDAGVGDVVALGVLQHQRQVRVDVLDRLVLVVLHPVPVGELTGTHIWEGGHRNTELYTASVCVAAGVEKKKKEEETERERKC